MTFENIPDPADPEQPEVEPISPSEAEKILEKALKPYLDDDWRLLDRGPYAARLTRGVRNLDIRIDLLGQVDTEESGLTPLQESGRLIAWLLLLAALLIALAFSAALGIL